MAKPTVAPRSPAEKCNLCGKRCRTRTWWILVIPSGAQDMRRGYCTKKCQVAATRMLVESWQTHEKTTKLRKLAAKCASGDTKATLEFIEAIAYSGQG